MYAAIPQTRGRNRTDCAARAGAYATRAATLGASISRAPIDAPHQTVSATAARTGHAPNPARRSPSR